MKSAGLFACSLVITLCGFGILLCFAIAAPSHVWVDTPHFDGIDAAELSDIAATLQRGACYRGGGGAVPIWTIALAP